MNTLKWAPYPEATVDEFRIYRSIIGFRGDAVSTATLAGKTLKLRLNGSAVTQTVTFADSTDVVTQINAAIKGGEASISASDSSKFYFRSDIPAAPGAIVIVGGTALADLSLTARTIEEKTELEQVHTEAFAVLEDDAVYSFNDSDGKPGDWYAITSVSSGVESEKSGFIRAAAFSGNICVVEGSVTDMQGVVARDCEVITTLVRFPHASASGKFITQEPIVTYTDVDGRFSLPLLQCALVQITIPAIGYSRQISVPELNYALINDILVETDDRFSVETRE